MMLKDKVQYYFWASYRRKMLDKLQGKYKSLYKGVVLDIGGRDRGKFVKPKDKVEKWIVADIQEKYQPDILLDVTDMRQIEDERIDVVNAIEVFEHVNKIKQGLKECYRVLKKGGRLILSAPFLYPIHGDPDDFQRWTEDKWRLELTGLGFKLENFEVMGRFFTVLMGFFKVLIKELPFILKKLSWFFYPAMDLVTKLDDTVLIANNPRLGKYHGGYFIIARK